MTPKELFNHFYELQELPDCVFRGQTTDFGTESLYSSLDRIGRSTNLSDFRLRMIEESTWSDFRQHAFGLLSIHEITHWNDVFYQWMLMRHLGIPTRLLDWTRSGWIALYFACSGHWNDDGAVWVFDGQSFDENNHTKNRAWTRFALDVAESRGVPRVITSDLGKWVCRLMRWGPRAQNMTAQQGLFTFASQRLTDHWSLIKETIGSDSRIPENRKPQIIRIDKKDKVLILQHLEQMGITAATLFPDISGIARLVGERAERNAHKASTLDNVR